MKGMLKRIEVQVAMVALALVIAVGAVTLLRSTALGIGPPSGDTPADQHASPTGHSASCTGQDPHKNRAFGTHEEPGSPIMVALHDTWHAQCDPDGNHLVD